MDNSDQLFLLIKSLNSNEKRYFKRYAKNDDTNYSKLFDAIASQKQYNEEKIKKRLSKEKFIRHIRVAKSRLYQNILKSLQDYHYNLSISFGLKTTLKNIEILYNKGLYDACSKLLGKIKNIAINNEEETGWAIFEIISWERKLDYLLIKDLKTLEVNSLKTKTEAQEYSKIYSNSIELQFLVDQLLNTNRVYGGMTIKKGSEIINKLLKHPLLQSEKNALSVMAKYRYNLFYMIYYSSKLEFDLSIKFSKRCVELIENNIKKWSDESLLLIALSNLCNSLYRSNYFQETLRVVEKIKKIPDKTIDIKVKKFVHIYHHEISTHNSMGEFQKASELTATINKGLIAYKDQIDLPRQGIFYIEMAFTFFGLRNYKLALKWINKILYDKSKALRQDLFYSARLLDIIVHFEMNNYELCESKIKSFIRIFALKTHSGENNKSHYFIELLFMRSLIEIIEDKKNNNFTLLKNLKEEIIKQTKSNYENIEKANYLLMLNWIESKIQKKSFAEIAKEKAHLR